MQAVPVQAVPSQTLTAVLGNQNCQINIYQKQGVVYLDLYVNNEPIVNARQCENANRIVRYAYLGFIGDLIWQDTQGQTDPVYSGMGTRYILQYLSASDLSALVLTN